MTIQIDIQRLANGQMRTAIYLPMQVVTPGEFLLAQKIAAGAVAACEAEAAALGLPKKCARARTTAWPVNPNPQFS